MDGQKIFDISPLLSPKIAVWPGDTPLTREVLCSIDAGSNIDLSTIRTTVHLGAHADAPKHYNPSGVTIEAVELAPYLGPCEVITVLGKELIQVEDCQTAIERGAKRVLFRTLSAPNSEKFNEDFCAFSPEAMDYLGNNGVVLVGIDTPSIDLFASKDLQAHQMLMKHSIRNLEGLVLTDVPDGNYTLIALPLKLAGFDASPVRAILVQ